MGEIINKSDHTPVVKTGADLVPLTAKEVSALVMAGVAIEDLPKWFKPMKYALQTTYLRWSFYALVVISACFTLCNILPSGNQNRVENQYASKNSKTVVEQPTTTNPTTVPAINTEKRIVSYDNNDLTTPFTEPIIKIFIGVISVVTGGIQLGSWIKKRRAKKLVLQ